MPELDPLAKSDAEMVAINALAFIAGEPSATRALEGMTDRLVDIYRRGRERHSQIR